MAHRHSVAVSTRLARFVWDVLAAADEGRGLRARFCEAAAAVFGCAAVGHVWWLAPAHAWSACVWRGVEGGTTRTLTRCGMDAALSAETLGTWWAASDCRGGVLELMPTAVTEVPLPEAALSRSVLVLGHERPPSSELARLLELALPHVALVERAVLRLEPPALPQAPAALTPLSRREVEVLALLSDGLPAHAIGHRMAVSERTIHKHLGNIYRKLGVHDRLVAVARGQELGLVSRPISAASASFPGGDAHEA